MPDKMNEAFNVVLSMPEQVKQAFLFALIGIVIGTGQLLSSKEVITARILIGRALTVSGLSVSAGAVVVWIPDLPLIGQIGVSALLASLGTSGLEKMFQRVIGGRTAQ